MPPKFIPHSLTTLNGHKDWLRTTALVVGSSAPVLFLGSMAATAEPARFLIDMITWPLGTVTFAALETRFLSAITAGFLLGWAVMIWCLRAWVYDAAPEGVRKSVVVGSVAWFVLDSLGVVLAGIPINVAFNVLVLLFAVGPLWWPARD